MSPTDDGENSKTLLEHVSDSEKLSELCIGSVLDKKIEIIALIGNGASSRVFKGRHTLLDCFVAVKVFDLQVQNESATQRFFKEAQILSTFDCENVVKLLSCGTLLDGRPYMVLEYLEGQTLSEAMAQQKAFKEADVIQILLLLCDGLRYVHSRGIIHRDLKPSNIMLSSRAGATSVKIIDFGISKLLQAEEQGLTRTGTILGTANYMSPEQCKATDLVPASDIYSLGCIAYQMLSSVPPFEDATDLLIMSNHINKPINMVPAKTGISRQFEAAILRCLQKQPADRFATVAELEVCLQECRGQKLKFAGQNVSKFVLSGFVLLLFGAGDVLIFAQKNKPESQPSLNKPAEQIRFTETKQFVNFNYPLDDEKGLVERQKWLAANIALRPANPAELAHVFNATSGYWAERKQPNLSPGGVQIESLLRSWLAQAGFAENRARRLGLLAIHLSWTGKEKDLDQVLDKLAKQRQPDESLNTSYRDTLCAVSDIETALGHEEEAELLAERLYRYGKEFNDYNAQFYWNFFQARKAERSHDLALAKKFLASCKNVFLESQKSNETISTFHFEVFCSLANKLHDFNLLLELIPEFFSSAPSEDNLNHGPFLKIKIEEIRALIFLQRFKQADQKIEILQKDLSKHHDDKIRDSLEVVLIQSLISEGKSNDACSEVERFLKDVSKNGTAAHALRAKKIIFDFLSKAKDFKKADLEKLEKI